MLSWPLGAVRTLPGVAAGKSICLPLPNPAPLPDAISRWSISMYGYFSSPLPFSCPGRPQEVGLVGAQEWDGRSSAWIFPGKGFSQLSNVPCISKSCFCPIYCVKLSSAALAFTTPSWRIWRHLVRQAPNGKEGWHRSVCFPAHHYSPTWKPFTPFTHGWCVLYVFLIGFGHHLPLKSHLFILPFTQHQKGDFPSPSLGVNNH